MSKHIVAVTGSRAEYGLLEPLFREIRKYQLMLYPDLKFTIVVTGSHLSRQFGLTLDYIHPVFRRDVILSPTLLDFDGPIGTAKSMGIGLLSFPELYANLKPSCVVMLGDRFEIVPAALAAYVLQIPIAHIEGDDITKGSLDDGYRKCIDVLASLKFPVSEYGSLACVFDTPCVPNRIYDYVCVFHPCIGNWKEHFRTILDALKGKNVLYIGSNADAGGAYINQTLKDYGCKYAKSLPRYQYIAYLKTAKAIIGNSSSGIIEAPSLRTATINIGRRQEKRMRASSIIDIEEPTVKNIEEALKKAEQQQWPVDNPYARPDTVQRIAKVIVGYVV